MYPAGVVGVTGPNAAGKGEVIRILQALGFHAWSLSDMLREDLKEAGVEPTRENLIRRGRELRVAHGPGVLASRMLAHASEGTAVDSIRHPAEVEILRTLRHFSLISLEVAPELRFARMQARARAGDAPDWESFQAQEAREKGGQLDAQDVPACIALADVHVSNTGSLEDLRLQVETFLMKSRHLVE